MAPKKAAKPLPPGQRQIGSFFGGGGGTQGASGAAQLAQAQAPARPQQALSGSQACRPPAAPGCLAASKASAARGRRRAFGRARLDLHWNMV